MGFDGALGDKKLRKLQAQFGIPFDRAWAYHPYIDARVVVNGKCRHYEIDKRKGTCVRADRQVHYSSCIDERE